MKKEIEELTVDEIDTVSGGDAEETEIVIKTDTDFWNWWPFKRPRYGL